MNKNQGFTLIELLVVIAIIGILASVVLASLNSARTKGADAAVKSNMQSIRAQAEIYYDDNSAKYQTGLAVVSACTMMFADPVIVKARAQVTAQSASGTEVCQISADGQHWAYSISKLKGSQASYCVDNSGASTSGSLATATTAVCS